MKYEYCGISLGDDIKDIINKFDISKIEYKDSMKRLYFKFGNFSKKTNLECFFSIPIKTGKVIYIIIFDENFKLFNELEIWQELTDEIKEKYELYYDEDDDGIYLSKKYKYLKIGVDEGYGRIEGFKDYKERIFSFIFDAQEDIRWILQQDKITNYLECQNLQDIYNSLYDSKTLDVDIEKREIYGQLDNYKFIFSLLTRDIKSIQNLETGEFIKTSLEQIEIKIKISLKFLILKAIQIENIYIAFSIVDPRLDITVVFEGTSEDLGYKVKVIFTDPSNSPQLIGVDKKGNTYIKNGTAYVDKDTGIGYILVNTESPANSTKAGVIGTIAEEQRHVIGKKEGRQKLVPDGSQKGLESLGRPTNDYFKKQYSKNDKAIELKSDGKDYSNVDFGENVGDHISSKDLKFKNDYKKNVLPKHKGYQKFLKTSLSTALDVSILGVSKGITESIFGYDVITGEKLDLSTRMLGIIPGADYILKNGGRVIKSIRSVRKVENVLADSNKVMSNVDDAIKGTNNTKKIVSSTDTSITKIEVETPKIKPVEDIIGTKTGNKKLNNAINTRGTEYYLKQLDEKKAPVFATISDEKLTSFQNEVSKTGTKLDLKTGELIGPRGGKGKVVGTTPDGKVVVNMAGRNVIFENGKQNPVSAGSLKKIEIPKTNEVVEVPTEVITKNNTKKVPENMLNGILDKAKSKITGKPVAQVQLERIGVDVKVRNSGIKIDGTTRAGDEIDKIKNNLGHNFPIYDNLEVENGVTIATSTKARDITSKTYSSTEYKNGFYNRIKGDIDDILSFEKGVSGKTTITKDMIDKKVLEISINKHELTKQQIDNIKRGVDYGKQKGVEVKFIIEKQEEE